MQHVIAVAADCQREAPNLKGHNCDCSRTLAGAVVRYVEVLVEVVVASVGPTVATAALAAASFFALK